ncbi:hypothetical protein HPB51_026350 [Rhipicephalus microplus]|uniref:Uncharacterized protein n=1 Tax=Rhipicephalus microplus TaxID=6941 RepID=A0A9J6D397_RHIMP|nr:hypothetical protein HPB51_026350 [Rhipicephalus microplus]
MHIFIRRFVEEVKDIGTVVWSHAEDIIKSKVHVVLCCVDAPARASILNMKQFNGYYGCSWCLEKGTCVDGSVKYLHCGHLAPDRSRGRVLDAMRKAQDEEVAVERFKGPSPLADPAAAIPVTNRTANEVPMSATKHATYKDTSCLLACVTQLATASAES